jgi:hypothetical protein
MDWIVQEIGIACDIWVYFGRKSRGWLSWKEFVMLLELGSNRAKTSAAVMQARVSAVVISQMASCMVANRLFSADSGPRVDFGHGGRFSPGPAATMTTRSRACGTPRVWLPIIFQRTL